MQPAEPAPPPSGSFPPEPSWRPPVAPDDLVTEPPLVAGAEIRVGRPPRRRLVVNLVLLALTLATTIYWGFLQYQEFYIDDLGTLSLNPLAEPGALLGGIPFGLAVIAFLLAHEMGHYLACRYYGIDATLPFFIPIPPVAPFILPGTMGAVIRILEPIKSRRALFDIAVAGPIAGFLVALPLLAVGITQSRVIDPAAESGLYLEMGEPLIWEPLVRTFGPPMSVHEDLLVHPLAFVGWFALLVTAMNLLPVGQLDGGHILYALFPKRHRWVSRLVLLAMLVAGVVWFSGWVVFALIVALVVGTKHPRPLHFDQTLGETRVILALVAVLIFFAAFMLEPIRIGGF